MRRTLFSATSALALVLSQSGGLSLATTAAAGGAIVLSSHSVAQAQDLDSAKAAVNEAKAALDAAKASGEGEKEARQALEAARAERDRIAAAQKASKGNGKAKKKVEVEESGKEQTEAAREKPRPKPRPEAEAAEKDEATEKPQVEAAEEQPAVPQKQNAEEQAKKPQAEAVEKAADEAPATGPADSSADNEKADKDKATRKAKNKPDRKPRKQAAEGQAKPSPDAPEAKPLAEAPIKEQIEQAAEKPASVLPDDVSVSEQKQLRAAEKQRRNDARNNRQELLGAAGAAAVIGALIPALGGRVVEDEGDRLVVERDGRYYVRKDESALFRDRGQDVEIERMRNGLTRETIYRTNGSQIITVRDPGGYALRRVKVTRNGERIVLFDIRDGSDRRSVNYDRDLPPLRVNIPRDQYIVSGGRYGRRDLAEIFEAPPVEQVTSGYSLREVRESDRLRSMVRRVDLDTITFDTGSATVRASQVPYLADIAGGMLDVMDDNPAAVFLIEGHTDAVGSDVYNLTLSDRRAETVARILVDAFDVPPENLVVQGYGEQYLKIDTDSDERRNRRVAIRNISPLLTVSSD